MKLKYTGPGSGHTPPRGAQATRPEYSFPREGAECSGAGRQASPVVLEESTRFGGSVPHPPDMASLAAAAAICCQPQKLVFAIARMAALEFVRED